MFIIMMKIVVVVVLFLLQFSGIFCEESQSTVVSTSEIKFYEEPSDTYLTKTIPAILKCKIENARTGFFKCNNEWSEEQTNARTVQVGNKQILNIEQDITRSQIEEHRKVSSEPYWCICQGWSFSGETVISRKAYVKLATIGQNFVWEPMTATGQIGKSVEIRCLAPEGDPKPNVYWLKNGIVMDKSNKRVFVSHEGSLLVNDIRPSDNANYTCIAENLAGKRVSDSATLIVMENKGWSDWSNWTECSSMSNIDCGEGIQKRYRTCHSQGGGDDSKQTCEGSPVQILPCVVPCGKANEKPPSVYEWSDWGDWLIECDSRDNCLKIRKRTCLDNNSPTLRTSSSKCTGSDSETTNCSKSYCENHRKSDLIDKTKVTSSMLDSHSRQYILASIIISGCLVIAISILLCTRYKNCRRMMSMRKYKKPSPSVDHPIYYSVQPDYTQDTYMDICSLLPTNKLNIGIKSSNTTNSNTNNSTTSCNSSISATTTTSNGDHASVSPTDSLKFLTGTLISNNLNNPSSRFKPLNLNHKVNEYEIIKLINEQHQLNPQPMFNIKMNQFNVSKCQYENSDLHVFDLFNNGGFLEIPKYAFYALIPDQIVNEDLQVSMERVNYNGLELSGDQTLLSSVFLIKCQKQTKFAKPIILSLDNTAQSIESDWDTRILFKNLSSNSFEEIDKDTNLAFYSYMVNNRSYIMTESVGYYAIVGKPKTTQVPAIKYMKYAILINSNTIKVILIQNTRIALEIVNEEMGKSNGKLLQIPKLFELKNINFTENKYFDFEITVNSNKINKRVEFSCLWNLKKDFYEIEIPLFSNQNQNLNINACFKHENEFIFSYSTHEMFLSKYEQQEFYSSVSVNPVFVPMKVSSLLDDYMSKSFKMSTLKKNDWRLFADLLNCDRNEPYFANKPNSFELIISLWLLINLNQNENFSVKLNLLTATAKK